MLLYKNALDTAAHGAPSSDTIASPVMLERLAEIDVVALKELDTFLLVSGQHFQARLAGFEPCLTEFSVAFF